MSTQHDAWEHIHSTKVWGAYPTEHVIRFVARNYYGKDRPNIKILDFGCGAGANTWYLAREGFDTYAFDISETAVARVKERLVREKLSAHVQAMDGMALAYPENSFDAVIDCACITANTVADIKVLYNNIWGVLKTGGKLLSIVFNDEMAVPELYERIEPGTYKGTINISDSIGCQHYFQREELRTILEDIGFHIDAMETSRYTDRGNVVGHYMVTASKQAAL